MAPPLGDVLPTVDAGGASVERGGNEATSAFEVWRVGPTGWEKVAGEGVSSPDIQAGEDQAGWHRFLARVQHGDGSWSSMQADNWLTLREAENSAPTITITNPAQAATVAQGETFEITWDAADADGDATSVYLWAFSWSTGWRQIGEQIDGATGSYQWETGAEWIEPGWYCFSAWITDGQAWRGVISGDWVQVTEAVPVPDGDGDGGEEVAPEGYSAEIIEGVLRVTGTDANETISLSIWEGQLRVTYGEYTQDFSQAISSVLIRSWGGDDVITVANDVELGVTIYAGAGADSLYVAGMGSDVLYGGEGDDLLISIGGGADAVYGGDGVDSLWVDSADTLADASEAEYERTSVHVVGQFYASWTAEAANEDYVSLEIAGQDLRDPEPTSANYVYKDFSNRPLFAGTPTRDDVNQGYVGDCYYLAALASVADMSPHLIEEMITDLGDGTYAVRFYSGGQETFVRVDGEMPVWNESSNSLVYAKLGGEGQLWVAVAEKAYAHFRYGSNTYQSLSGGWMSTVYRQITDKYSTTVRVTDADANTLWTQIQGFLEAGRAVTVGSISSPENPIVGYHAYTITAVSEEAGELYVTVHNPWGIDGRNWDNNYGDGLMTITMASFLNSFSYVIASYA